MHLHCCPRNDRAALCGGLVTTAVIFIVYFMHVNVMMCLTVMFGV